MKNQFLLISLTTTLLLGCSSTGSKSAASSADGADNQPKSWFCQGKEDKSASALQDELRGELKDAPNKEWDCSQLTKQEIALREVERQAEKADKEKKHEKEKAAEELAASKEPARTEPQATDLPNTTNESSLYADELSSN